MDSKKFPTCCRECPIDSACDVHRYGNEQCGMSLAYHYHTRVSYAGIFNRVQEMDTILKETQECTECCPGASCVPHDRAFWDSVAAIRRALEDVRQQEKPYVEKICDNCLHTGNSEDWPCSACKPTLDYSVNPPKTAYSRFEPLPADSEVG